MTYKKWDVKSEYTLECDIEDDLVDLDHLNIYIIDDDELELPDSTKTEIIKVFQDNVEFVGQLGSIEVIIPFRCKGYYDSGRLYGPPEKCYPPEGDSEYSLYGNCELYLYNKEFVKMGKFVFSKGVSQELFDTFEQQIMNEDIGYLIYEEDWRY